MADDCAIRSMVMTTLINEWNGWLIGWLISWLVGWLVR